MNQIKIFHGYDIDKLQAEVNAWLRDTQHDVEIDDIQFQYSAPDYTGIMVIYSDAPPPSQYVPTGAGIENESIRKGA